MCAEGLGGERSTGKNVGQWLSAREKAGEVGSSPPPRSQELPCSPRSSQSSFTAEPVHFSLSGFLEVGRGWYPNLYCFNCKSNTDAGKQS